MDDPKPQPFPETFKHDVFLDELKNERFHGTNIPDFFRQHNSFELRKIMIDMFSRSSDTFQIHSDAQADWEELLTFLKKEAKGRYTDNLFLDVLSAYVFKADALLIISALRFAINQLEGKHGVLAAGDEKIIKIICGCINKREFDFFHSHDPISKELAKRLRLEGLFVILPEILPVLQAMLDCIYDHNDIASHDPNPRIEYRGEDDFIQIRRAIEIIVTNRKFNTDFLPAIDRMAIAHKFRLKKERESLNIDYAGHLLGFAGRQAILDESVRLLKQAQKDNIENGATRRQEILNEYSSATQ